MDKLAAVTGAHAAVAASSGPAADEADRKRLSYVMAFRVGLVTLLLAAALVAELGAATGEDASPVVGTLWALIAATYGLTIVFALLLRRAPVKWLAGAQLVADLVLTTVLVHLTGGAESAFAFMYILVIVGASFVLPRAALPTAAAAILLYLGDGLLARNLPLRPLIRTLAVNAVAFAATAALAARLAIELRRAGERIVSQAGILRDLAALYEHVVRGLTSGLVTVDREGRILTFNAAAAAITGRTVADAVGRNLRDVMPGVAEDAALRRAEVAQTVRRGDGGEEQRTIGISISPLSDGAGRVLGRIINFQDLTELRRMEVAMQRAEQLAAVGRLAAGVAHEIRNPLAAISGSIELLSQTAQSGADKELMSIVLREVERLNTLITELLEFARPRPLETQRLDMAAELSEMVRVFEHDKHLGAARVELRAPAPVWIEADAGQLRQVVWNLVRNAAEASGAQPIVVDVRTHAGKAQLTVRDRGPGLTAEQRARLFEPFYSTKEGGTGLGLATVHRIVEAHRGSIEVESPRDGGASFTVRLPLVGAPAN